MLNFFNKTKAIQNRVASDSVLLVVRLLP